MLVLSNISFAFKQPIRLMLIATTLYISIALVVLREYIEWSSANFLLGLLTLWMIMSQPQRVYRFTYAYVAILFLSLAILLPVKTFLFFSIGASLLFISEILRGSKGLLPLFVIGLMSPVSKYFVEVFSFPIRLQLTSLAGSILKFLGNETEVKGNMISFNGSDFAVDPECMGLNMLTTSLLSGIMLISLFQKRYLKQLSWWKTGLFLGVIVLLNIGCNLFRIAGLVLFRVLPGTFMHDLIGICCLLIYVIVPGAVLAKFAVSRLGSSPKIQECNPLPWHRVSMLQALLMVGVVVAAIRISQNDIRNNNTAGHTPVVAGYEVKRLSSGILKLENAQSLVYVKRIPGFYNTDHNPMICWRGSGYNMEQVQQWQLEGSIYYTAILKKDNDLLHTAWWYDNGQNTTINQMNWRWDALRTARDYSVVNVTTADKSTLAKAVKNVLASRQFRKILE